MAIVLEQQTDERFLGTGAITEFNMVTTIPAGSNGLLVLVSWLNDVPETITSIIWDPEGQDEALSLVGVYFEADDSRVEAWYLHTPTVGASKNVEVIFSAAPLSTTDIIVDAFALSGAHATAAIRQYAGEAGATLLSLDAVLSSAVSGDFIAAAATIEASATSDWDSSTITITEVYVDAANPSHNHGYGYADGAGETLTITWSTADHCAMIAVAIIPGITTTYEISGITKDKDGVALGSCLCFLCKDNGDNTIDFIEYQLSNASTGAYAFTGLIDDDSAYLVIAWKDLATHVFDVTDFILTPIEE